ncbi:MAG: hypothetical protein Q8P81_03175 [Nanoarchaeota archaeon]|nr:hypothetical protein [Nanoarchaeota archaeon]
MKICSKCKEEREESEFYFRKDSNKYRNECKKCFNEKSKKRDKEKLKIYKHQYYEENRKDLKEKNKEYRRENKEKIFFQRKQYREKEENRVKRRKYKKSKYVNDVLYKLRNIHSALILRNLKRQNSSKRGSSILQHLSYDMQELKEYLENQFEHWMNWNNWGKYNPNKKTWQIDHIIPQSKLPYDSMEHENFKKCWALENLRPLEAMENNMKGNRIV